MLKMKEDMEPEFEAWLHKGEQEQKTPVVAFGRKDEKLESYHYY